MATTSIKRAAFTNMAARYASGFVNMLYGILLARILTPDDFGLVAIAQVFVTLFTIFTDMGLGAAVIQRQDLDGEDHGRLFAFSAVLGLGLAALFAGIGFPMASVYGHAELRAICSFLSVSLCLSTLNTVPNALLMKQKRFVLVGVRQVIAALASSVIGLASALAGLGYFAIVIYSISSSLIVLAWNLHANVLRPVFRGMMRSVSKVYSYSAYLFGFNLVNYFSRNMDNLLIGYFFGTASLGNYSKAYQLMQYPQTLLTSAVTPVMHPMLAGRQDDKDYIYGVYVKTCKILSILGVFISVFCYFCSREIVTFLYGEQWLEAIPCFNALAICIWSQMVCGTSSAMFQVLNRTREQFVRGILIAAVIVGSILFGIAMGSVEAVAVCVGVAYYISFILVLPFLVRMSFGRSIMSYLREFVPDACAAAMLVAVFNVLGLLPIRSALASLLVKGSVGAVAYLVMLVALRQLKWLALVMPSKVKSRIPDWMLR